MIHIEQFRDHVVVPTLKRIDMHSPAAEQLVLATGLHESNLFYLKQLDDGPALGFFQMEPATHLDIWQNYLRYRPDIASQLAELSGTWPPAEGQLVTNLAYATAMCRIHYYRRPEALPPAGDAEAMAMYWKSHYNTELGAGTVPAFILTFNEYVLPLYRG